MDYHEYINARRFTDIRAGFEVRDAQLTFTLKPHQKYLVKWALLKGRAAIFADTGLGKTRMLAEWARLVSQQTGGRVLFLSPLAVAPQTVIEAAYVGVDLRYSRHDAGDRFTITNYEMIDKFDMSQFVGIVLDESSILKNFDGRTRADHESGREHPVSAQLHGHAIPERLYGARHAIGVPGRDAAFGNAGHVLQARRQ